MSRFLPLAVLVFAAPLARADDALAPAVVAAVKKATVFVRVEGDGWSASGSGFVVAGDDKALLLATNHHVAAPKTPPEARSGRPPALSVVFDSGTKAERSYPATVAGADADRDLAVLRVAGVTDPPEPIPSADAAKPTETMPVYSFGFPFGKALSQDKGFPAVTVGKASVSSLRDGPDGELAVIQIDGNLNPGNSGGPVVDAKGRLVGVAVATIRDSQGIGLIIPAGELAQMMRGRVGKVRVVSRKETDGKATARVEVALIDPTDSLRNATAAAYYLVIPPKGKRPEGDTLAKLPGGMRIDLTVEKGVGVAEIPLAAAEGELLVQVALEPAGRTALATRPQAFPLAATGDLRGPPPAGWKEYLPRDRSFVMWVPEKPVQQSDRERTSTVGGQRVRVSSVLGRTADGLVYEGQSVVLPPAFARAARKELYDSFRDAIAGEFKGRVTDTRDVTAGKLPGVEHVIEFGKLTARVRMYVVGARVLIVQVVGSAEQVAGTDAETVLSACRLPDPGPVAPPPVAAAPPGKNAVVFGGHGPAPAGGGAYFKDVNPEGGLLVGVEVVVGRIGDRDAVRSVLPLFRVGKTESFGKQFGTASDDPVTLKAKPGYAVGGITAKAGDLCDGFALLYMRVVSGRLDPADSYASEWVGGTGPAAARVASDGTPVVGLAGRENAKDVTGLGLIFKGQEGVDPVAPSAAPAAPAVTGPALPAGKEPTILGGAFDPQFKDVAPAGGLLVGFEVGTAPAYGFQMTRSVRPIYRVGDKESFGEQRGTQLDAVVTLKAKAGYAVGAISAMHGLGFDGLSVTFMKVADGKLDPADRYESEYVGSGQKKPLTKIGGDGTPVIGIAGKSNAKDMTGMGLLFRGQEGYDPTKKR